MCTTKICFSIPTGNGDTLGMCIMASMIMGYKTNDQWSEDGDSPINNRNLRGYTGDVMTLIIGIEYDVTNQIMILCVWKWGIPSSWQIWLEQWWSTSGCPGTPVADNPAVSFPLRKRSRCPLPKNLQWTGLFTVTIQTFSNNRGFLWPE